jgi:hypothetical protein
MTGRSFRSHRLLSRHRATGVLVAVAIASLPVSPPASATASGLSVTVTQATIRFREGSGTAGLRGTMSLSDGSQVTCGVDVQFSLGGLGSWKADGGDFKANKAGCIWRRGDGRLHSVVLDVVHGTWAFTLKGELDGVVNPVDLRMAVGAAAAHVSVPMTEARNQWRYP